MEMIAKLYKFELEESLYVKKWIVEVSDFS